MRQSPEGLSGLLGVLTSLGDLRGPFTTAVCPAVLWLMQARMSYISDMNSLLCVPRGTVLLNPHLHVDDPWPLLPERVDHVPSSWRECASEAPTSTFSPFCDIWDSEWSCCCYLGNAYLEIPCNKGHSNQVLSFQKEDLFMGPHPDYGKLWRALCR